MAISSLTIQHTVSTIYKEKKGEIGENIPSSGTDRTCFDNSYIRITKTNNMMMLIKMPSSFYLVLSFPRFLEVSRLPVTWTVKDNECPWGREHSRGLGLGCHDKNHHACKYVLGCIDVTVATAANVDENMK